jgi:hypothetical protein
MARRHTPHDRERGLTALAIEGSSRRASQLTGYSDRTIRDWAQTHPQQYAQIKERRAALIDQACIEEFRQIVLNGTRATQSAIAAAQEELKAGNTRDPAATARNLATASAIAADKIALMEGRPTQIIEHRSSDDVLRDLERGGFIDAHAIEDPEPPNTTEAHEQGTERPLMPEGAVPNARELPESTG